MATVEEIQGVQALIQSRAKRFAFNGQVMTLRIARKDHTCIECHLDIHAEGPYYEVVFASAGLGALKFPYRTHEWCLEKHLQIAPKLIGGNHG